MEWISGKANPLGKYDPDQPLPCHSTPFYERLEDEMKAEEAARAIRLGNVKLKPLSTTTGNSVPRYTVMQNSPTKQPAQSLVSRGN